MPTKSNESMVCPYRGSSVDARANIGIQSYMGELQKPRGGGPIFFSAGGPDFSKQGGSLQKFSLEFHRVIEINKIYRKI